MNTRPFTPSLDQLAQPGQSTRFAQSRSLDELHEAAPHRIEQCQLQLLPGPEMREHAALGHTGAERHSPDRQSLEPLLPRQLIRTSEDQFPGDIPLLRDSAGYHGDNNSTNVRSISR